MNRLPQSGVVRPHWRWAGPTRRVSGEEARQAGFTYEPRWRASWELLATRALIQEAHHVWLEIGRDHLASRNGARQPHGKGDDVDAHASQRVVGGPLIKRCICSPMLGFVPACVRRLRS